MSTCKDCGEDMSVLFSSLYCPNDCDRKEEAAECENPMNPDYLKVLNREWEKWLTEARAKNIKAFSRATDYKTLVD